MIFLNKSFEWKLIIISIDKKFSNNFQFQQFSSNKILNKFGMHNNNNINMIEFEKRIFLQSIKLIASNYLPSIESNWKFNAMEYQAIEKRTQFFTDQRARCTKPSNERQRWVITIDSMASGNKAT